jgi:hypothetical protein
MTHVSWLVNRHLRRSGRVEEPLEDQQGTSGKGGRLKIVAVRLRKRICDQYIEVTFAEIGV